jgi:glycosyltransferase involved in cell wall biosynthesis
MNRMLAKPRIDCRPLMTVGLFAYNQERYIKSAIEGMLRQTYSPLEIIISDDCSSDRTFDIIKNAAAAYRGPHHLLLNRNRSNLGICGHVNRVCELARGEWLIAGAGDDISLPERVEVLAASIKRHPTAAYALSHAITFSGDSVAQIKASASFTQPLGATEAFRLSIFREFGALLADTCNEDWSLYFRAQIKGDVILVERPLVRYRLSEASLTRSLTKGGLLGMLRVHRANLHQFKVDAERLGTATASSEGLVNSIATRIRCCDLLLRNSAASSNSVQQVVELLSLKNVPWRAKCGLAALYCAPGFYSLSERLRRSRLRLASPSYHAMRYLNPVCLLKPPTPVAYH